MVIHSRPMLPGKAQQKSVDENEVIDAPHSVERRAELDIYATPGPGMPHKLGIPRNKLTSSFTAAAEEAGCAQGSSRSVGAFQEVGPATPPLRGGTSVTTRKSEEPPEHAWEQPTYTPRGTMTCESLGWLNALFQRLWPQVNRAIEKLAREQVEPLLRLQLPKPLRGVRFKRFSLGTVAPNLGPMKVCDTALGKGTELRLGVNMDSDVDIALDFVVATVGVESLVFSGEVVCRLEPLLNEVPVVGGIVFYFLDPPKLDLKFTGAASVASYPGVMGLIQKVADSVITKFAVLPNVVAIPLGAEDQGVDRKKLHVPAPRALLRVTALRANNLMASDVSLFGRATSDPYVRMRISDEDWQTSTVKKTVNPVWKRGNTHDFLVFDPEQTVSIEVFDEDLMSKDDLIGCAQPYMVAEAVTMSESEMPLWTPEANFEIDPPTAGTLEMRLEYLELCDPGQNPTGCDVCLLEVDVDSVYLPSSLGSGAALMVEVCQMTKKTPFTQHASPDKTTNAVDAALNDVVERCQAKALDPDLVRHIMGITKRDAPKPAARKAVPGKPLLKRLFTSVTSVTEDAPAKGRKDFSLLTIDVEYIMYFVIPTSALKRESVNIMITDPEGLSIGEATFSLRDLLDSPGHALPKIAGQRSKFSGECGEVDAEVRLRLRGFQVARPELFRPRGVTVAPTTETSSVRRGRKATFDTRPGLGTAQVAVSKHTSLQWLNELAARIWPQASNAIKKIVFQEVTPLIREQLPGPLKQATFNKLNLGEKPPSLGPLQVIETSRGLELRLWVNFEANIIVELDLVLAKLGVKAMHFRGEVIVRLEPLLEEVPVIGGLVIYFLDPPKLDLQFTGAASMASYPGVLGMLRGLVNKVIAKFIVLPNVIAFPLATEAQGVDRKTLNAPRPIGILRATVLSAQKLRAADWGLLGFGASSDPYVRVRLSDEEWTSSHVSKSLNPVWRTGDIRHEFLVFDQDQRLYIDVYDYDFGSSDDHLGRARPLSVTEALARSQQPLELFDENAEPSRVKPSENRGTLIMSFEWLEITAMDGANFGSDGCVIEIFIDEIRLPASLGSKAGVLAKLTAAGVEKHTPVKSCVATKDATDAVGNAVNDLIERCQAKALDPAMISSITGVDVSGAFKILPSGVEASAADKAVQEADKAVDTSFAAASLEAAAANGDNTKEMVDLDDAANTAKGLAILSIDIEEALFILVPPHHVDREVVEVAIVNHMMRPMGTVKVSLMDIVCKPEATYPYGGKPVQMTAANGSKIDADITIKLRNLQCARY